MGDVFEEELVRDWFKINTLLRTASNAVSPETKFESESRLTRPNKYIICYMIETFDVSSKYYVYILWSYKDKGLYIGYTTELKNRLTEHAAGRVTATKLRIPLKLIHYEYFLNRADAKAREEFLKSGFCAYFLTQAEDLNHSKTQVFLLIAVPFTTGSSSIF